MSALILKPGREKSLLRRHPWIFSGAVARADGDPGSGATVDLLSSDGGFLARASYSAHSQISARVWTFVDEPVDEDLFRKRVRSAIEARYSIFDNGQADSMRLIYAESDRLPGLIVDRYGGMLVLQSLTAGSEHWKETIADILVEETGLKDIYERSDSDVRELEGLEKRVGLLRGKPADQTVITEYGVRFNVNFLSGHKTGFYLDQSLNRQRVRALARDRDVLDCFCYTGGFTVNALAGGAKSVVAVDSSAEALALGRENLALNGLQADRAEWIEGDIFQVLRKFRDAGRSFDMLILDPPKFAPTSAQAEKAARGYKDINLLAFKLLRPGGLLATFSCSGGIDAGLFQKIVASAALDAGVDAQILEHFSQSPDHPVALEFPEGAYLKGVLCLRL
jgi:23S rRNA (cytosine1962-C5)-methyltransferase